jgi:hypothetical protein
MIKGLVTTWNAIFVDAEIQINGKYCIKIKNINFNGKLKK